MARAIKFGRSVRYLPLIFPGVDIERLKGNSLRVYLEGRLQSVEERLAVLYNYYRRNEQSGARLFSYWENQPPEEEYWDGIFELDYLEATRAALLEAIQAL